MSNPVTTKLTLEWLPESYAICQFPPDTPLPSWFAPSALSSASYTQNELSIVAPDTHIPSDVNAERGWRAIAIVGPLAFSLVGIMASLLKPLADAEISVLALSTYDTDILLVRELDMERATNALSPLVDIKPKI